MGKNAKFNIPMCAAMVLLLLTMISIHITSGLYARYTSDATATASARVAKFDVDCRIEPVMDGNGEHIEGQFWLIVDNKSEVAVTYRAVVEFDYPLEEGLMSAKLDTQDGILDPERDTFTFANDVGQLAPETSATHKLQFFMDDWKLITEYAADVASITKTLVFDVDITAEQID